MHWYDAERFERLIAAMLNADRRSGRVRTVRELVAQFRGLSGTAKQKVILAELGLARASLEDLVGARLGGSTKSCSSGCARRHGRGEQAAQGRSPWDHRQGSLPRPTAGRRARSGELRVPQADRPRSELAPRIAEIGFAFDEDKLWDRLLLCGLNNSPALSDAGAFRELGVDGLGGLLGDQYAGADAPITFIMHVTGARLAFTDRGKSAVSL